MVLGALGILAIPSSALAVNNCSYAGAPTVGPVGPNGTTVTVYTSGGRSGSAIAGVCVDQAGLNGFDGGYGEVGAGEDPAVGAADPGAVAGQPDGYAVVDGSDANSDPTGRSDGYIGVSNWENGDARTSPTDCTQPADSYDGPDHGTNSSTNSGGCEGVDDGPWIYVGDDVPTPVCGNTSGNDWAGISAPGSTNDRDGCSIP
jgi:hypothetical protein